MCRFVLYLGPPTTLSSLVTEPAHSIIHQSYQAKEREEPLNGDGFGVAWYAPALCPTPACFKDVSPAWNNRNLLSLAPAIESGCLLAHVRAASPGMPVSNFDCHPFTWDRLTMMHNGVVAAFAGIRRELRRRLSDEAYAWIRGGTDSEHLFALFTDRYRDHSGLAGAERLVAALDDTIGLIEELTAGRRGDTPSFLNLAVTDGACAVVSRYSSDGRPPETLYTRSNCRYRGNGDGEDELVETDEPAMLVASEPLTADPGWRCIDRNHFVVIDANRRMEQRPVTGGASARPLAD